MSLWPRYPRGDGTVFIMRRSGFLLAFEMEGVALIAAVLMWRAGQIEDGIMELSNGRKRLRTRIWQLRMHDERLSLLPCAEEQSSVIPCLFQCRVSPSWNRPFVLDRTLLHSFDPWLFDS